MNPIKLDRAIKNMATDGFKLYGSVSGALAVKEGQIILLKFRGNVILKNDEEANVDENLKVLGQAWRDFEKKSKKTDSLKIVYNTNIKSESYFKVKVMDKYSQKALNCYKGFLQVYIESEKKTINKKRIAFAENSFASTSTYADLNERSRRITNEEDDQVASELEAEGIEVIDGLHIICYFHN